MKKYLLVVGLLFPAVAKLPHPTIPTSELYCLALNAYHEARGEPIRGIHLVTRTVVNRAIKQNKTFCEVITAPYQFSWTHAPIRFKKADYEYLLPIVLEGIYIKSNATHYHAKYVKPIWAKHFKREQVVGNHIFYICTKNC